MILFEGHIMLLKSDFIDLETPTGTMRTYVHKPTKPGKYPAILFYSEIFQQTGPIERAAKIIASHGYAVLVPEVFHELNQHILKQARSGFIHSDNSNISYHLIYIFIYLFMVEKSAIFL